LERPIAITTINGIKIYSTPIYCSDLGMTENDINSNNIDLLINGICQFGCIYIDKIYKMKL